MTDKKEVSILLLGIVAVLAIVGLVLLFSSRMATGQYVLPVDHIIIIPIEHPCDSLPPCADGRPPVDLLKNFYDPDTGEWTKECGCLISPPTDAPLVESPIDVSKIPPRFYPRTRR
jgi:hypothetical protein